MAHEWVHRFLAKMAVSTYDARFPVRLRVLREREPCIYCGALTRLTACSAHSDLLALDPVFEHWTRRTLEAAERGVLRGPAI